MWVDAYTAQIEGSFITMHISEEPYFLMAIVKEFPSLLNILREGHFYKYNRYMKNNCFKCILRK